jgi:protein-disulfide isomerase
MHSNDKMSMGFTGILVICALFVVSFIIKKNFFPSKPQPRKKHVARWQQLKLIGQRTGPANAPVQIAEFFDYQCPFCEQVQPAVKAIRKKYPKKVSIVYINFPLKQVHPHAFDAAIAAECARHLKPTSFMAYHDGLFTSQNKLGQDGFYRTLASNIGIVDTAEFDKCRKNKATASIVKAGEKLADQLNIHAIPTFLVNGILVTGTLSKQQLNKLVQHALAEANK